MCGQVELPAFFGIFEIFFSVLNMSRAAIHPDPQPNARGRAETLPPGTPAWITMELVRETIEVWSPFYKSRISLDDAVTILRGVGQLFDCLTRS